MVFVNASKNLFLSFPWAIVLEKKYFIHIIFTIPSQVSNILELFLEYFLRGEGIFLRKVLISILLVAVLGFAAVGAAVAADFGAGGAQQKDEFTFEEMLTYAIQDEYLARAEYEKIMAVYGVQKPFSNIILSEERHIAMLKPLFGKYGLALPPDTAADYVILPGSLLEAYETGVTAEINNIAMYDKFLEQELPYDVKSAFIKLRDASYNHLAAFQNKVDQASRSGSGGGGHKYRGGR